MPLIDLGKPFSLNYNDISDSRWNAKTWSVDSASNLFNSPEKIPGQFMLPTTSGDDFTKNQPCFRSVDDADTIIAVGIKAHLHRDNSDSEGGALEDVFRANLGHVHVYWGETYNDSDFDFTFTGTGAGVTTEIASNIASVRINTGTSTNGYASIARYGLPLRFAEPSMIIIRNDLDGTLTSYVFKFGIHPERVDEVNTNDSKYGIEGCSGQTNYQCFSADGAARSVTPSSVAVDTNDNVWAAEHFPDDEEILYTFNSDSDTTVTKSSDVPTSGGSTSSRYFLAGIQSTNTTAKQLKIKGVAIAGFVDFANWTIP